MIQLITIFSCLNCILFILFSKTFVFDYSLIISSMDLWQSFQVLNGEKNGAILLTGSNNQFRNYESWILTSLLTNQKKTITNKQNETIKLVLFNWQKKSWKFGFVRLKLVVGSVDHDICQQIHLRYPQKITWKSHSKYPLNILVSTIISAKWVSKQENMSLSRQKNIWVL